MRVASVILMVLFQAVTANALVISEIMSNPVGDDSGREWVELYNDGTEAIDLSTLALSIKGGGFIATTQVQGGMILPSKEYAIVSSIVSASSPISKFLDASTGYPSYTGILLRVVSSASFVNTGTTSLDIRLGGVTVDGVTYSPAGEGKTLSKVNGVFVSGTPTPGSQNQEAETTISQGSSSGGSQTTISQTSPPSPDIVLYLPENRLVIAGAETEFSVYGATKAGKTLEDLSAVWSFGDGGQSIGTTTIYAYAYPGRYIARVDAGNASVRGVGTTKITVVSPEISIQGFGSGKYGAYVDIENPNEYDLDISQWRLIVGYGQHSFPKNTVLEKKNVTRIAGRAMGFEKTSLKEGDSIKIVFPNLETVSTFFIRQPTTSIAYSATGSSVRVSHQSAKTSAINKKAVNTSRLENGVSATKTAVMARDKQARDTRLALWFKSFFSK